MSDAGDRYRKAQQDREEEALIEQSAPVQMADAVIDARRRAEAAAAEAAAAEAARDKQRKIRSEVIRAEAAARREEADAATEAHHEARKAAAAERIAFNESADPSDEPRYVPVGSDGEPDFAQAARYHDRVAAEAEERGDHAAGAKHRALADQSRDESLIAVMAFDDADQAEQTLDPEAVKAGQESAEARDSDALDLQRTETIAESLQAVQEAYRDVVEEMGDKHPVETPAEPEPDEDGYVHGYFDAEGKRYMAMRVPGGGWYVQGWRQRMEWQDAVAAGEHAPFVRLTTESECVEDLQDVADRGWNAARLLTEQLEDAMRAHQRAVNVLSRLWEGHVVTEEETKAVLDNAPVVSDPPETHVVYNVNVAAQPDKKGARSDERPSSIQEAQDTGWGVEQALEEAQRYISRLQQEVDEKKSHIERLQHLGATLEVERNHYRDYGNGLKVRVDEIARERDGAYDHGVKERAENAEILRRAREAADIRIRNLEAKVQIAETEAKKWAEQAQRQEILHASQVEEGVSLDTLNRAVAEIREDFRGRTDIVLQVIGALQQGIEQIVTTPQPNTVVSPRPGTVIINGGEAWTYNPEHYVALSRDSVQTLMECVSPAAKQFSDDVREAVVETEEALGAYVANLQNGEQS